MRRTKLSEHLFQISGVQYETNSNIYAIQHNKGIILIDCGFQKAQWERMTACMDRWNLKLHDITHVFLTHSHFDHAGNVWRVNRLGAKVLASADDAEKVEHGNPEMEELFGASWICGRVDQRIREGDCFSFPGDVRLRVLETPGHCRGALSFLIEVDGLKALCTGDMFFVTPFPPRDQDDVELGYMGSRDFSLTEFQASLGRLQKLEFDLLLPGHYYFYGGAEAGRLIARAYEKARALKGDL